MKKKIVIIFDTTLFAFYMYISFLSFLDGLDTFFNSLVGVNTRFYLLFMYPYEERKNMTLERYRFEALEDYYNMNLQFVLSKHFYAVAAIILLFSVIGWKLNNRNSNSYKISKIILVIISVLTILITICNTYYNWWWWDTEVV